MINKMVNKIYCVPLDEVQRRKIRKIIENLGSLAELTREETVFRIVNYLLEDKPLLERYLSGMAALITKQRQQISYRALFSSIFHTNKASHRWDKEFQAMLTDTVEKERKIQKRIFAAENYLQTDISSDLWKMYVQYGDVLRLIKLDFSSIHCRSLRHEVKYYHRYVFERTGRPALSLLGSQTIALNALTDTNPQIKYFTDITEADVKALLLFLETSYKKKDGDALSQYSIAAAMRSVARVIEYLMSDMRDDGIKAPRPYMNYFAKLSFRNMDSFREPTSVIPEEVVEQISSHSDELPPIHKVLYDIFVNTGLRLKEVLFLEEDCVEESNYTGFRQLKFKPHKVLAARRRHGAGDYHRVMITQALADEISCHINDTAPLRTAAHSSYIFLSLKPGCRKSIMASATFVKEVRNIITKYDVRDENGELWHLTAMQFRKTIAVRLIENGATIEELAYWLGHMCRATAATYYAEVRKAKLAELNTKFFRAKFDLIISGDQLERYTEEERKLLYVDFRLEQRRVELGYCLRKTAGGGCSSRSSLYNCVNCKNLCTGEKYLPYWNELLIQQKEITKKLIRFYHTNGIEDFADFAEYKQETRLLKGYESIVAAIKEGGAAYDRRGCN
jgi:integrase